MSCQVKTRIIGQTKHGLWDPISKQENMYMTIPEDWFFVLFGSKSNSTVWSHLSLFKKKDTLDTERDKIINFGWLGDDCKPNFDRI